LIRLIRLFLAEIRSFFLNHVEPLKEMNAMKTLRLFSMAALALVMVACNEIQQPEEQGKMHFSATLAVPNNGATTRTTATADGDNYNVAWKVGDRIALVYEDSNGDRQKDEAEVTAVDGSGNATIECYLTEDVNDGADVTLVYPCAVVFEAYEDAAMGKSYTFDSYYFTSQEGAAPTDDDYGIPKYDWRDGDGTFSVSGSDVTLSGNVTMNPNVAIWKLTLKDVAADPFVADIMFIQRGGPVAAVLPMTPASVYYVYVPVPQLIFLNSAFPANPLVITGSSMGNDYSYVHSGDVTLTAGKIYESTVTLKQVLSGWITDGVDGYNIFYIDGETWAEAIANHNNWNFTIQDGKVYSPGQMKYLKNAAGTAYIDPATAVDPDVTYSWGE